MRKKSVPPFVKFDHLPLETNMKTQTKISTLLLAVISCCAFADAKIGSAQTKAMSGFCPVTILDSKEWKKGEASVATTYDNRIYYFVNEDAKTTFLAQPAKYVPAFGGDCSVCIVNVNNRIAGSVFHSIRHKGRLFLFPQDDTKKMFKENPAKYENGDLALGGKCAVCKKGGKDEMGKPEFTVIHQNMRYQFPTKEIMAEFARNPSIYVK